MYAGHIGFALGTYSFRRTIPLWLLLIAAQIPDWLDAGMCMADRERGPYGLYTHGIPVVTAAALMLAILYVIVRRDAIGALLVAVTVASHYGLDYITGLKPTWSGGPLIGLQLYSRPVVDVVVEACTILVGWWLYRRTVPRESRNDPMMYGLLVALIGLQVLAGVAFYLDMSGHVKC